MTLSTSDYMKYVRTRNQCKSECRKADRDYGRKVAKKAKTNPKCFMHSQTAN